MKAAEVIAELENVRAAQNTMEKLFLTDPGADVDIEKVRAEYERWRVRAETAPDVLRDGDASWSCGAPTTKVKAADLIGELENVRAAQNTVEKLFLTNPGADVDITIVSTEYERWRVRIELLQGDERDGDASWSCRPEG